MYILEGPHNVLMEDFYVISSHITTRKERFADEDYLNMQGNKSRIQCVVESGNEWAPNSTKNDRY